MMIGDSQRQNAAADVAHEIRMLRVAWARHGGDAFAWTGWFIHARNLMRFFHGTQDHEDDILARHFFDPPGHWDAIREKTHKPAKYDDYDTAASKLAAHLTYGRADYRAGPGMPPSKEVTEYLLGLALAFVTALPEELRASFGGVLMP